MGDRALAVAGDPGVDTLLAFGEDVRRLVTSYSGATTKSAGVALASVRHALTKEVFSDVKRGLQKRNGQAHPIGDGASLLGRLQLDLEAQDWSAQPSRCSGGTGGLSAQQFEAFSVRLFDCLGDLRERIAACEKVWTSRFLTLFFFQILSTQDPRGSYKGMLF